MAKTRLLSYQPRFPVPGETVLCFDTETTSTDRVTGAIVEWSGVLSEKQEDGTYKRLKEFSTYINPGIPVSPGASAVNGITNEFLKTQPSEDEVWPEIKAMFDACNYVVGHNVPFDIGFCSDLAARCGAAACFYDIFTDRAIDTLRLSRELTDLEHHKLGQMAEFFNIEVEGILHDSLTDTKVTMKLYEILENLYREAMKEAEPKVKVRKTKKADGEAEKTVEKTAVVSAAPGKAVKANITPKNIWLFHYCDLTKTYGKAYHRTHVKVTCNCGKFDFDCDSMTWSCKEEYRPYDIADIAQQVFKLTGTKDEFDLVNYARREKQKQLDTYERKSSAKSSKKPA